MLRMRIDLKRVIRIIKNKLTFKFTAACLQKEKNFKTGTSSKFVIKFADSVAREISSACGIDVAVAAHRRQQRRPNQESPVCKRRERNQMVAKIAD